MFFTSAWCNKSDEEFKKSIPLIALGKSLQKFNSQLKIKVLILEGYELISCNYIDELINLGFEIINFCDDFNNIILEFNNIKKFYSQYERNCFLRWIAYYRYININHIEGQIWHLDSDIILHTSLESLKIDTLGKTFMLQGCPVFTSISNLDWFLRYENELISLDRNIIDYSNIAFSNFKLCLKNDRSLANVSLYRNPIGSDQDLLEYLISSKKIIQDSTNVVFDSDFYWIQNPLMPKDWAIEQIGTANLNIKFSDNGRIYVNKKSVPFIHFQSSFTHFASFYILFRKKIFIKNTISTFYKVLTNDKSVNINIFQKIWIKIVYAIVKKYFKRNNVIEICYKPRKELKNLIITEIINYTAISV